MPSSAAPKLEPRARWELDVHTQRVGQHLTPERAAGEAASGPDLANLVAGGAH